MSCKRDKSNDIEIVFGMKMEDIHTAELLHSRVMVIPIYFFKVTFSSKSEGSAIVLVVRR